MKNIIILPLLLWLVSCKETKMNTTAITILADRTDNNILKPNYKEIKTLLELEENPNNGVIIKFLNIGNTDFNPIQIIEIKQGSVLDNSFQRKSEINEFYKATKGFIEKENSKNFSFQKSSIINPLLENLKDLQINKGKKILILYSDLAELSEVYNSYQENNQKSKNPKAVADLIKKKIKVPKVNNTILYIIHYPKTDSQNRNFKFMLTVYKELFKESDLEIKIGIENQINY